MSAFEGVLRTKFPRYYVARTLLDGGDVNRRTIYDGKTHEPLCIFNPQMRDWNCEDERKLEVVVKALIADAEANENDGI